MENGKRVDLREASEFFFFSRFCLFVFVLTARHAGS